METILLSATIEVFDVIMRKTFFIADVDNMDFASQHFNNNMIPTLGGMLPFPGNYEAQMLNAHRSTLIDLLFNSIKM
jgi:hypothetical protein